MHEAGKRTGDNRDTFGAMKPATRSGIFFRTKDTEPCDINFIEGEHTMNVEVKDMPALRVAAVQHNGPYNRISEAFTALGQIAGPANLFGPNSTMLAIYHGDPETTPEAELRSAAGVTVPPDVTLPAELAEQWIPAGVMHAPRTSAPTSSFPMSGRG